LVRKYFEPRDLKVFNETVAVLLHRMSISSSLITPFNATTTTTTTESIITTLLLMTNFQDLKVAILRPQFLRLLLLILVLSVVTVAMMATQIFADNIAFDLIHQSNHTYMNEPLFDLVLSKIPFLPIIVPVVEMPISDFSLALFILTSIVYLCFLHPRIKSDRLILARRYITALTISYFFRLFCVLVTRLPGADPNCIVKKRVDDQFWMGLLNSYGSICTDMIFSGHTVTTIHLLWLWILENPRNPIPKIYASLHAFGAVSLFLMSRLHYSVDILVGLYVAILVSFSYSVLISMRATSDLKTRFPTLYSMKKIVDWIECSDVNPEMKIVVTSAASVSSSDVHEMKRTERSVASVASSVASRTLRPDDFA
jgi:hypothetical protein